MTIIIEPYRHDWTVQVSGWRFGVVEFSGGGFMPTGTTIYYGPGAFHVGKIPAPVVASAFVVLLIGAFLSVKFVIRSHRSHFS